MKNLDLGFTRAIFSAAELPSAPIFCVLAQEISPQYKALTACSAFVGQLCK